VCHALKRSSYSTTLPETPPGHYQPSFSRQSLKVTQFQRLSVCLTKLAEVAAVSACNGRLVISEQRSRWKADAEMRPTWNSQPPKWNATPHAGFGRSQAQLAASVKSCECGKLAILGTWPQLTPFVELKSQDTLPSRPTVIS